MLGKVRISSLCPLAIASIVPSIALANPAPAVYRAIQPSSRNSKTTVELGGLGAVIVEPLTPTVVSLGFNRYMGVTANNVGSKQFHEPNCASAWGQGPRNMHCNSEAMVMVVRGPFTTLMGEKVEKTIVTQSGEFLYIPGNVWHQWVNPGMDKTAVIVEAHGDANDNSNVQIIPTP
jgi:uncharacterized RmlC-like cupin family protein